RRLEETRTPGRLMKISVKTIVISVCLLLEHDPADRASRVRQYLGGLAGIGGNGSVEIETAAPDCSLSWPTATTRSPGLRPLRISARPSTRLRVCTKGRTTVSDVLPSASFFSVIRNTESP